MNKPIRNWDTKRQRPTGGARMLRAEEEQGLIAAWQEHGDLAARDRLLAAFQPLARSMTRRYTQGGASEPDRDLLQQANIGLLKALERFDPDNGARFSTYAGWWMRAEIQDFKMANLSVVRRPNTARFRNAYSKLARLEEDFARDPEADRAKLDAHLAHVFGVTLATVGDLRAQVTGRDSSLNIPAAGEDGADQITLLEDPGSEAVQGQVERLDISVLRKGLVGALSDLPPRERDVIIATQLQDPPATLEGLGARMGISKERVRQLRERAFERLRVALRCCALSPDEVL
ncbi:sigma-70 family RNA polymerase sigma factor [Nioella sp.]|uniref:sigma-70 family RNA polymerase sigma factor n=1 Tax=Nioella sp. TaxID=1912091 RepID=UPI003A8C6070